MASSKAVGNSESAGSVEIRILDHLKHDKKAKKSKGGSSDHADVGMHDVYKNLTVLADKIVSKLNEMLKDEMPEGLGSLKPEEHTPEATATRIVAGSTALFSTYAKQHPELQGEELISKFMETIRSGIKSGYNDAAAVLGDLGAFDIDGVKEGIEETMRLVEEKLAAFENDYRVKNGLAPAQEEKKPEDQTTEGTPSTTVETTA